MHLRSLPVLFLLSTLAFSQSVTSLRGRVTDPSHAVVSGAQVRLTSLTNGATREQSTDSAGAYEFPQLQPGRYSLRVSAVGFQAVLKDGLELLVATPMSVDVTLSVASEQQHIEVTSAEPVVNTVDATLGNAFDERQVNALPLEGRNVVELLSLQPGVTFLGKNAGNSDDDSRSGSVNGARGDQSNVTLDGVDVNDQNKGYAFTSVLRMTQDSIQEFRVTTSNPNADGGRGSGAQVTLITKSGTNQFHGSAYEYNRNAAFTANDWFNKQTQIASGEPNKQLPLIRNIFGGSVGGPVRRDKIFFFANYEGRRDNEGVVNERLVPTAQMRQGVLQYVADDNSIVTLTPNQILGMDPNSIGVNQAMLTMLNTYPVANDSLSGDGLNTEGFRFSNTEKRTYDTYIARLDWNVSRNHTLFWRGNLMGDTEPGSPQFPGQPASSRTLTNSKGFALGYTAVIRPNLVNNFRWGLTRQGGSTAGTSNDTSVGLQGLDSPVAFSRTSSFHIPVHDLVDDLAWTKGNHSFQFGTNIRIIDDARSSTSNSFPSASINTGWLGPSSAIAGTGQAFDPSVYGYPAVGDAYGYNYDSALMDLVGIVTEGDAIYNYDRTGNPIALGAPVQREYRWNEYDFYGQDAWKVRRNLTVTLGLRYSYLQAPAETHGDQVGPCLVTTSACQPYALTDFYNASAKQGLTGGSASNIGTVAFDLNGRANGKPDFWQPDKGDFSPRVAIVWAPDFKDGFLSKLFGGSGKSSIRAGYALTYDHFGAGVVNTFDTSGSFGLSSNVSNPPGFLTVSTAPRFQGVSTIPAGLLPAAPPGGFPATPDPSLFAISWGLDSKIKTPYSHLIDFSVSRELTPSTSLEVSYVGRLAHRLMSQQDVAMPLDIRAAGTDYFAAAAALSKLAYAQTPVTSVANAPYWEQQFGALDGADIGFGPLSATQNVYELISQNLGNETYALFQLDLPDSQSGAGVNTGSHTFPSYRYYHDQYSALYAWRSIGQSYYHALEVLLRQRFRGGLQADLNYTYSKSIDWTSQAERLSTSGGNNNAQIINSWLPAQLRGVSDFDMTHQINANWVWDLPVGHGKRFLGNSGRVVNGIFGNWELTGIVRWTSGLPYAVDNGSRWPTNWDIEGFATQTRAIPSGAAKRGNGQQMFSDPAAVYASFRQAYPGESGNRNPLRGDGYYTWDAGLDKTFQVYERTKLQFRWEVFNVTNSVRFDPHSVDANLDNPDHFGLAGNTLTEKRVMQISARVEF
jgi:hypothetical protein